MAIILFWAGMSSNVSCDNLKKMGLSFYKQFSKPDNQQKRS